MRKYFFLFLTMLFFQNTLDAQLEGRPLLDSLLTELPGAKEDTSKVNLLYEISFDYYAINPVEGIRYGNLQMDLAVKLNWKKGIASAHNVLGTNFMTIGDYPTALQNYLAGLKIAEEINNKKLIMSLYGNIAIVYSYQPHPDNEKALEYYSKAVKMGNETGDKVIVAVNLTNIGQTYFDLSKDSLALIYYFRALKIVEALGRKTSQVYNLINIGSVYSRQLECSKALEYQRSALQIAHQLAQVSLIGMCQKAIGYTCLQTVKDSTGVQLKKIFGGSKMAALQQAKQYTDSAIANQKINKWLTELVQSYKNLSEIQNLMGDQKGALESYMKYTATKDSVFNIEKDKKLTQAAMQYEFDKKEAAAKAEQEKKDIQQRNIRNAIGGVLAGTLIFLAVVYYQRNKISTERKRSEGLLLNILPAETAQELKNTGTAKAKDFDEVTVLFTDFKNFTLLSEQLSAQELVNEINYCYSAFDNIITKYGIEKIKTIGDSYMCAGGVPVVSKTHAEDTVKAAIEIRNFMATEKLKREAAGNSFFEIRIGCHTGPVVAGIVGIKKFAYDIWGDTVNIASRMESSGEPGMVNISGTTYELVKDTFKCTYRGKIQAKNKGNIDMYFVEDSAE